MFVQVYGWRGNYVSDGGVGCEKGVEGDYFDC